MEWTCKPNKPFPLSSLGLVLVMAFITVMKSKLGSRGKGFCRLLALGGLLSILPGKTRQEHLSSFLGDCVAEMPHVVVGKKQRKQTGTEGSCDPPKPTLGDLLLPGMSHLLKLSLLSK